MKGSGTDLATITAAGFPKLRLDEVLLLRERDEMDDATMVDYLVLDHTHPDAVIALTCAGRAFAEETFGDEIVWLDYQRPGFAMSKRIAELLDESPSARAVLLEKHGLVTWGDTPQESYRSTIDFVSRAAAALERKAAGGFGLGGAKAAELGDEEANAILSSSLPRSAAPSSPIRTA